MTKENPIKVLVKELIIGFGFAEGLWIYAGVNPITEIVRAFSEIVPKSSWFSLVSFLLIFGVPIVQIVAVYCYGGVVGWLALLLAFLGGIFIGTGIWGVILVLAGMSLGYFAFSMDPKIGILDVIEFIQKIIKD